MNKQLTRFLLALGLITCIPASSLFAGKTNEPTTALFVAITKGSSEEVKKALENGANANAINEDGVPPLFVIITEPHNPNVTVKIIQLLLDHGAKIDSRASDGVQAIHLAAMTDVADLHTDLPLVKCLLGKGAKMTAQYPSLGLTPLASAIGVLSESPEENALHVPVLSNLLELSLQDGLDINTVDQSGRTTLHMAAGSKGLIEFVRLLLKKGADKTIKDKTGKTAADVAKNPEIKKLIEGWPAKK
jgi:uncharacterized protein